VRWAVERRTLEQALERIGLVGLGQLLELARLVGEALAADDALLLYLDDLKALSVERLLQLGEVDVCASSALGR